MHANGNPKLIETFFLRDSTNEKTSQIIAFQEIVVLRIGWQQGKVLKLNNEYNKHLDPDR